MIHGRTEESDSETNVMDVGRDFLKILHLLGPVKYHARARARTGKYDYRHTDQSVSPMFERAFIEPHESDGSVEYSIPPNGTNSIGQLSF